MVREIITKLHSERIKQGLTQEEVGRRMNISKQAIQQLENNESGLTVVRLIEWAKILNLKIEITLK